jgi:transposase InsO family protein
MVIAIMERSLASNPTTTVNRLRLTDFTYQKVVPWGRFFQSTMLDDFSRYIVAWMLMRMGCYT